MRRPIALLLAAVASVTTVAPVHRSHADSPSTGASRPARGSVPSAGATMRYHGGPVMIGPIRLYVLWFGDWSANRRRQQILVHFMSNLTSPWFAINRGYPDSRGRRVANSVRLAQQVSVPAPSERRRVSDADLASAVRQALEERRLPVDASGVYLVLTGKSVDKAGFLTRHCGWHDYFWFGATSIKYAFVGDPTGPNLRVCAPQTVSPNGDAGADAMASTIAHEISEAVTNPEFTGWFDEHGNENADRCAWQYGRRYRRGRAWANMRLGRRHYYIQMNWRNTSEQGCSLTP